MKRILNSKNLKKIAFVFFTLILLNNLNIKNTKAVIYINPGNIKEIITTNECVNTSCEIRVDAKSESYALYKKAGENRGLTNEETASAISSIDEYLLKLKTDLISEYDSVITNQKNAIENSVKLSERTDEDKKAISVLNTIIENGAKIVEVKIDPIYQKMASSEVVFYQNARRNYASVSTSDEIEDVTRIWRRVYIYKEITKFLTTGSTTIDLTKVNPKILIVAKAQQLLAHDGGFFNLADAEHKLAKNEINPDNGYMAAVINDVPFAFSISTSTLSDPKEIVDPKDLLIENPKSPECSTGIGLWGVINSSNVNCSIAAYLINIIMQGINVLIGIFVSLAGSLFDWVYDTGVINFKSLVDSSGAYIIYKTVILSLLISVMTFVIFYLIIRRLIDDDGENMNKLLPKIIITALFVYFSFTIAGWIIDQSNIITIYLHRSLTNGDSQTIATILKRILSLENGGSTGVNNNYGISLGSWKAVPYTAGQVLVSAVGVFVLFEGAILLLTRSIVLLLCMIFSPIMLIPEGLTEFTDKYRKVIIDNFTGNVMLGPVFMFLLVLAVKIGDTATTMITASGNPADSVGAPENTVGFLGGVLASVLVITVLQLAISVSKSLSGSIGEKIGGQISKYAGGAAFGGGAKILRGSLGGLARKAESSEWMKRNGGSTGGKFLKNRLKSFSNATFDARNSKAFQSAAGQNSYGQGSSQTASKRFEQKLYKAKQYHEDLNEGGKKRNLKRLRGPLGGGDGKEIADKLDKNWKPSMNERLNNDSSYNERFDKAHNQKDDGKRGVEVEKMMNEHFKENGLGDNHFSKEIEKPENNKIKQDYQKGLAEKDSTKRKEILTKVVVDLGKKSEKEEGSIQSLTESLERTNEVNTEAIKNTNKSIKPDTVVEKKHDVDLLTSRLREKYSKQDVQEHRSRREQIKRNVENSYQDKVLEEAKEREANEIKIQKEANGGFIPSVKDTSSQNALKDRLKEKYSSTESMVNGEIVKGYNPDLLDYKKEETKSNNEKSYQDKVLEEALEKALSKNDDDDDPTDDNPSTPSSTNSQKERSDSMSVNKTGKLTEMYTPEQLSILNKNRNGGNEEKKVA